MSIYKSAVKKPITTMMVFIGVMVFGIYFMTRIPVDLYPEMELPAISVMTLYPGANASDIETNITKLVENALNSVENLKEITSVSRENMSVVTVEFEWGINMDEAANNIRNNLEFIKKSLPDGSETPLVFKFNSSLMPIMFYAITASESYEGIQKIIDDKVINYLNRIDGVGSVALSGIPERKIYVEIDPVKLQAMNLTLEMVGGMIQAENISVPSGNIKMGLMDYQLRIQGEFTQSEQIKNIALGSYNGQTIRIRDVANVRDTIKDMNIDERINGEKGIRMMIQKQSGANTVSVANQIIKEIEKAQKTLPADIQMHQIFNSADFIDNSINNLTTTLMWTFLFIVLVVLFFLGRIRATLIVILTIPVALITAFIFLGFTGGSLNIISLTSLSIAIGMVIDDAIVVLENITRHIERGSSPREAAIYATNEVWVAVIVTTVIVVAVFMPLTMVTGMMGEMFKQLGWIVTITVVTSTLAGISLTPMLCSKMLKLNPVSRRKFSYDNTIKKGLDKFDSLYERLIRFVLRYKGISMVTALLIFAGTMMLLPKIGTEFIPQTDQGQVSAVVELQTGIRVEETSRIARQIEAIIQDRYHKEIAMLNTSSGADDAGGISSLFGSSGSHVINVRMRLLKAKQRDRSCWDIAADFREQLVQIPEIIDFNISFSGGNMMGGDNDIKVEIYGYDFNTTGLLAADIAEKIKEIQGAVNVKISRDKLKPELEFVLDPEKMSLYGLNTASVATALRNRVRGMTATNFREEGEEYEVIVRLSEEYRSTISGIEDMVVTNPQGVKVRLFDVGEIKESYLPPNIDHKRRERIVSVSATPEGVSLGQLANEIQNVIDNTEIPGGVIVQIGGAYENQQDSFADLGLLMLVALILVYIVMASQFESFKMPVIIMVSIPFSFSGVVLGLYLTGTNLSIIAALGAVLLIGIVVKNAILLIDYTNLMRDRGYALYEALALSGKSRLRPVLMTALTSIFGMLPLALSTGEGAEIWRPMGISVIGGLTFSTFLTLVIVPVIYAVLDKTGSRSKRRLAYRKEFSFME